jgi:hypothetical protein
MDRKEAITNNVSSQELQQWNQIKEREPQSKREIFIKLLYLFLTWIRNREIDEFKDFGAFKDFIISLREIKILFEEMTPEDDEWFLVVVKFYLKSARRIFYEVVEAGKKFKKHEDKLSVIMNSFREFNQVCNRGKTVFKRKILLLNIN